MFYGYPKLTDPARALKSFVGYGFHATLPTSRESLSCSAGACLIIGLFTRGAALLLAIEMGIVLTQRVKIPRGLRHLRRSKNMISRCCWARRPVALASRPGRGLISLDAFTFESAPESAEEIQTKRLMRLESRRT